MFWTFALALCIYTFCLYAILRCLAVLNISFILLWPLIHWHTGIYFIFPNLYGILLSDLFDDIYKFINLHLGADFFFFGELLNFSGSTVNYFRWYLHFWVFKYRCSVWVFWILLAVDVNQFYMGHPAPKINGKKLRSQSFVILPIFINISMLLKSIVFILFKFI